MAAAADKLTLGLHYHRQGRLAEAEALYREVLEADPDNADAAHLFGVLAHQLGRHDLAIEAIGWALARQPDRPDFHSNIGEAYRALRRYPEAETHYRRALALRPDHAEAHNNLGLALQEQGRLFEAIAEFHHALLQQPNFAEAHNNLGTVFQAQHRLDQAVEHYRQALAFNPTYPEAHCNLGNTLAEQGQPEAAALHFEKALALRPDFPAAHFGLCMAQLPVLYRDEAEIERCRGAYGDQLGRLDAYLAFDAVNPQAVAETIGANQPFFLAYQGRCDRELQARYGAMIVAAMARRYPAPPAALPAAAPGEPIRVGFVCGWFRNHSVWKIPLKGWLTQLDRSRFRLFCYHTRGEPDAETAIAAAAADQFVQGPLPLEAWRERILADAPHVLIYPEIGMDPITTQLAAQRLARVQCTSWGHPDTSGLPTIDHYLSSDLMEPAGGAGHYTEALVRLPNLSFWYEPPARPALTVSRAELGLRPDAVVYWCCQSLFKYRPLYDEVFPRIAAQVPGCQFTFIAAQGGKLLDQRFRQRLAAVFARHGLDADAHCVILPRLSTEQFIAAAAACDLFLDSLGWSGINSTLEAMVHDLPVVTWPGPLMRGRHSAALLRMIDVTETIADSVDDYVALAVRLGRDPEARAAIRCRLAANKAAAWRDPACIAGLASFLERVAVTGAASV